MSLDQPELSQEADPETVLEAPPTPAVQDGPSQPTRLGAAYTALIAGAVVLVVLLLFILQNTAQVRVTYFGASGHLPLGVALLLAAVAGALIVGIVGSARIFQVRRRAKRTLTRRR